MDLRSRVLYHQIHPAKLAVDITGGLLSTALLWRHLAPAPVILLTFVASIVTTAVMVRRMDFSRQRDSALGRYVAFHMTRVAEAVRMAGQVVMWWSAWSHSAAGVVAGALVIALGWTYSWPAWRLKRRQRPHHPVRLT